ncbi:MAG TPA: PTS sugar transporter subunit IIA [Spirochaetota bacterium]|nr:PTS sugar transporter subunit IIA [Spirochaetota bacterium]HPI90977.1 PTS sugar transporter subunit IIA [Spirochaetota bacterium]HPR47508.1 PTS sugar transporter subunit IIA [Spirochaetota bacterium]
MSAVIQNTDKKFIKKLDSTNKMDAIEELARVFTGSDVCSDIDGLVKALKEREEIMSTGIGFGIAIPHARLHGVKKMTFAVGISTQGIDFDSMDGDPVHLIILVAAGEKQHKEYLRLLSTIMAVLKNNSVKEKIIHSETADDVIKALNEQ